ncbi:MAG TPA: thiamine phosphate synthase [Desulfuromonadaceae bacterium]|jgi:thiamine-phosphate pyrophosphorylase
MTDFSIYLITDRHQTAGRPLAKVVDQALQGGIRAIQLREKDLPGRDLYDLAMELRQLTDSYDALLIINDRLDIALATNADGVHLGAGSLPVAEARRLLGAEPVIGYSAHSLQEARLAEKEGANFITLGPVFYTSSKVAYGAPLGLQLFREACATISIPVYALGGINLLNCNEAMAAGAHGIALISAIIAAPDPLSITKCLLQKIEKNAIDS